MPRSTSAGTANRGPPQVMAITWGGQTWVCVRRDGAETVAAAGSIREGLEMFAAQLQSAIRELPPYA